LDIDQSIGTFRRLFDREPELLVDAPGRVNLIGGSTDYNQGYVLPAAIDRTIQFFARRRDDRDLRVHSNALAKSGQMGIMGDDSAEGWLRYLAGILIELSNREFRIEGLDLLIDGDLPPESGLGSSAALEIGFLSALKQLNDCEISEEEMITICHQVENRFVGMNCGIMDQFISYMGLSGHALLLDCRDMSYQYVDLCEEDLSLLLVDSGVKRDLVRSDYNTRRDECFAAVRAVREQGKEIRALRDLGPDDLPWLESFLEPVLFRRCRHVITENLRVSSAVNALAKKDLTKLGRCVNDSHKSLRDDFEVSCERLDYLFDVTTEMLGVYGARLIGAGFGGNLLALVEPGRVAQVTDSVTRAFRKRFGEVPRVLSCGSYDGVSFRWL
jgi:galactokinase